MGNHHSASHAPNKPRKNVHWKSAGRPAAPGKPEIIPISSEDEPNAITLRWGPGVHDGGAPLRGYQVECNRLGSAEWLRTAPPLVLRPELLLSGLAPPHRYQFRVAALNAVGRSDYSPISDVLTVNPDRPTYEPPVFLQHLQDITALENDKTEYRVSFTGTPAPTIAWFKDDYEIFSSRRTAITTDETSSVLVFHQTLPSDEGEIKCTATNRGGHAVTKSRLVLEAAPKLRYPRQYEDGLLYEINETVFLKTTIVGKPTPTVEWYHDGQPIISNERVEVSNTPKFSVLKIHSARRSDRGEYQIHARNTIGEDMAAFLVTITAPPDPPRRVSVARQVDKSVTLDWEPPEDDGGCRIGNYVVEYYRSGWNVWLKATTSRKTNVTLFDLIEGSEYRFRVKAESPYGMSAPSAESAAVRVPGRAVDMEFLAVESRIINEALVRDGETLVKEGKMHAEGTPVSPAPRRKRAQQLAQPEATPQRLPRNSPSKDEMGSGEFMLVLYPEQRKSVDNTEKRHSLQLDPDVLSPPPLSLSSPELSTRDLMPFRPLRNAVSSTELLHEHAMARVFKAVAMKEEQEKSKIEHIEIAPSINQRNASERETNSREQLETKKPPEIIIKSDSIEDTEYNYNSRQMSQDSVSSEAKWQQISFDEDYTASTVSSDEEYSDEGSLNGETERRSQYWNEEDTYNPRDKLARISPGREYLEEEEERMEPLKPLPLPDPNFVPKPILKRRENIKDVPEALTTHNNTLKPETIKKVEQKPKKEEKITILKKITKMPVQKPFNFPKLLSKREPKKIQGDNLDNEKPKLPDKAEKFQDKITDEGKTVIDYYGNIVKEYGSHKRPVTPIYLNVDDLKTVAEKQQMEEKQEIVKERKITRTKKPTLNKTASNKVVINKMNETDSLDKQIKLKEQTSTDKVVSGKKGTKEVPPNAQNEENKPDKKCTQQVVLKKTERATIVIPIDYQELEEKAKINVRTAIDYTVDVCLLLLAFWVYLFKDERLAIPFLILIIYRQLQETILLNIPEWARRHTPSWIKKNS